MTAGRSTQFRATRIVLAAVGVTTALLAGAYLWTFTSGVSGLPLIICLHPNDVACSSDYFLGRDREEHIAQLTGLLVGFAGLALIAASSLWSKHLQRRARD